MKKGSPSINNLFIQGEIAPEKKNGPRLARPTTIKAIRVSPVTQRGLQAGYKDGFCTFTILVKETNPYFEWYKRAASHGFFKIREKLEVPA